MNHLVNKRYLQIFNVRGIIVETGQNKGEQYARIGCAGGKRVKTEDALTPNYVEDEDKHNEDKEDWIHPDVTFLPDMIVKGAVQKIKQVLSL